jgi:hypothetical protein
LLAYSSLAMHTFHIEISLSQFNSSWSLIKFTINEQIWMLNFLRLISRLLAFLVAELVLCIHLEYALRKVTTTYNSEQREYFTS